MENSSDDLIHGLNNKKSGIKLSPVVFFAILILVISIGAGAGFMTTTFTKSAQGTKASKGEVVGNAKSGGKTAGILDKKRFPDEATGLLKEGGVEGEGSFHLERPGGESQNVYLTSSIVDLSSYIGKKIKVRGETQKAQKAGWLMDVGYIEVL